MEKTVSRGLLVIYLVILIWFVLFKLTFSIPSLLAGANRTLNLIPFAAPAIKNGRVNYGEMIMNCVIFIPFGLLLSASFKKAKFLPKLGFILAFSFIVELLQYIFGIGATDITDLITNTLGGFLGLQLYDLSNKYISSKNLDRAIIVIGILLLLASLFMRFIFIILR
ncbi:VanZ family protein [Dyadobacter chenwenxiniae]|uniref:VanZ family protein n=1 Tax=Dyadobacter chenwenxiniae TaxID=2906456 RepID=A0A9X1TE71_9BACT|nr:VanZ family protein [Dyadobacter chenwenxiniae]MCF0061737.1 VanZ family protein [Dyadobacter chenwenxiniae]UON81555.1 VanZ family protein [Dyadobacter chenwenxiniae]